MAWTRSRRLWFGAAVSEAPSASTEYSCAVADGQRIGCYAVFTGPQAKAQSPSSSPAHGRCRGHVVATARISPRRRTSTQLLDALPHGNESPATREPGEGHRRRGASGGGELEKARQPRRASRRNWLIDLT